MTQIHDLEEIEYEKCFDCDGSGLELDINGEPTECSYCKGNTVIPKEPEE